MRFWALVTEDFSAKEAIIIAHSLLVASSFSSNWLQQILKRILPCNITTLLTSYSINQFHSFWSFAL